MHIPNLEKVLPTRYFVLNENSWYDPTENEKNIPRGIYLGFVRQKKTIQISPHHSKNIRPKMGVYAMYANKPFIITIPPLMKQFKSVEKNNLHEITFTKENLIEQNNNVFKYNNVKYIDYIADVIINSLEKQVFISHINTYFNKEQLLNFLNHSMIWNPYQFHVGWDIEADYNGIPFEITYLGPNVILKSDHCGPLPRFSV